MGPVPSSVVATVTWHVVGLHGGKQEACPLAGIGSGPSKSSGTMKTWGGHQNVHTKVIVRFWYVVLQEEDKGGRIGDGGGNRIKRGRGDKEIEAKRRK